MVVGSVENKQHLCATQAQIIPMQEKHRRQRQTTTGCPLSLFLAGFTRLQAQSMFTGSITCHLLSLSNWK